MVWKGAEVFGSDQPIKLRLTAAPIPTPNIPEPEAATAATVELIVELFEELISSVPEITKSELSM